MFINDDLDDYCKELQISISKNEINNIPEDLIEHFTKPKNFGRMNDPDGGAVTKGQCGDTMEMYLIIEEDKITKINFYTDGCSTTSACGLLTSELARGLTVKNALKISPSDVIDKIGDTIQGSFHCAILAVITLHKAIADYYLRIGM